MQFPVHHEVVPGLGYVPPTHPLHPDYDTLVKAFGPNQRLNLAPQIVEWDDNISKEVEEAKKIYQQARREQREIITLAGQTIEFFHPSLKGFEIKGKALKLGEFSVRILNEKGDETLIWDSNDPDEIEEAAKIFSDYLNKGWTPYAVSPNGDLKRKVRYFNPELMEVTFVEPGKEKTFTQKLRDFVQAFPAVTMLPKTYPG